MKTLAIVMTMVILLMNSVRTEAIEPVPRAYYGAKFEPVDKVIHGAGQASTGVAAYPELYYAWEAYSDMMGPDRTPFTFMYYIGVGGNSLAPRLEQIRQERGKYVAAQLALGLPTGGLPDGQYDAELQTMVQALKDLHRPVYLRIGYEINGTWWSPMYQPASYIHAFRRVTQALRDANVPVATLWNVYPGFDGSQYASWNYIQQFYPGDDVVDWWSFDVFNASDLTSTALTQFLDNAALHGKPVMIGEATPRGIGADDPSDWAAWFQPFFDLINSRPGIKGHTYIDWHWNAHPAYADWGDCRLETGDATVRANYLAELSRPLYVHAGSTVPDWASFFEDPNLVREDFEGYNAGDTDLSGFNETVSTSIAMRVVEDADVAHGGSKFYQFHREPPTASTGASCTIFTGINSPDGQPHIYAYTNYVRIGSTTLAGSSQVSSRLLLQLSSGGGSSTAIGGCFGLATARENTNRRIVHYEASADNLSSVAVEEAIDFPVDTWLKLTLFVDTINNKWGYEVAQTDGTVLKAVSDLAYLPNYGGKIFNPAGALAARTAGETTASAGKYDGQNNLVDDVKLTVWSEPVTLRGTVVLGDYLGDLTDVSVRIELRENGLPVQVARVNLDANGVFTLPNVAPGIYDVAIKSYAHLQKVLTNREVANDPTDLGTIFLIGGDSDGDNAITSTDLSIDLAHLNLIGE